MITAINSKDTKDFMKMGLYVDALRGRHSTGLATVDSRGEILINKKALEAVDFLTLPAVNKQIDDHLNRVFIGHNRHATRGAINNVNAHPFQHGKITMVHNGSLTQTHNLPDHNNFIVDSENIAHSLDKIGTLDTLKRLYGAFALVWWDEEEKRVKMARNSERPLTIATIENKNTVIWASEHNMLRFVAARSGLKISDTWELPENTIASFDPESNDIWQCDIQEDVEYYKHKYPDYNRNAGFHQNRQTNQRGTQSSQAGTKETEESREKTKQKIKERDVLNQKLFRECGIKKGEEVELCLYNFSPYNPEHPTAGMWEGCTLDDPYVSVVVYGLASDNYDVEKVYKGEAMCMQIIDPDHELDSKMNYRMVIDNKTIYDADEFAESTIIYADAPAKIEPKPESKKLVGRSRTIAEKKESVKKLLDEVEEKVKRERAAKEAKQGGAKKKSILTISGKIEAGSKGDGEGEFGTSDVDFLYLMGPRGLAIPYSEWVELTKHGCGICVQDISPKDAKEVAWWGDLQTDPVCPDCAAEAAGIVDTDIKKLN